MEYFVLGLNCPNCGQFVLSTHTSLNKEGGLVLRGICQCGVSGEWDTTITRQLKGARDSGVIDAQTEFRMLETTGPGETH